MAVLKTVLSIPSQNGAYQLPGDFSAAAVKTMYASQIPGLDSMVSSESTTVDAAVGGEVRTITFTPRTGNKG